MDINCNLLIKMLDYTLIALQIHKQGSKQAFNNVNESIKAHQNS